MAKLNHTSLDEVNKTHAVLGVGYRSRKAKCIKYRKHQLLQLAYLLQDNRGRFNQAINNDLGRSYLENEVLETFVSPAEIKYSFDNVERWVKPESVPLSIYSLTSPKIRKEAKGVVPIFVPYNYPIFLLMSPIAGAIAAGNVVCVKTSELLHAISSLLAELFPRYLDQDLYRVAVGIALVAAAAAKHSTPATLELGGKNPTIVDPKFDLKTCTAPEYVLVPKEGEEALIAAMQEVILEFFPIGSAKDTFVRPPNYTHSTRVKGLLENTKGTVVSGGEIDQMTRYIGPTIVRGVALDDPLMTEEIFGPILPIIAVENFDEAIEIINAREHPLALYAFTNNIELKNEIFDNTHSGACVHNDVIMHVCVPGLPFGGVGASGYGAHTGKYSFDLFTHSRATMSVPNWTEIILNAWYPPFTTQKVKQLEQSTMPKLPPRDSVYGNQRRSLKWIVAAAIVTAPVFLTLRQFDLF